jgi:hypothetical protein
VISGNVVSNAAGGGHAIYTDGGSQYVTMTGNAVYGNSHCDVYWRVKYWPPKPLFARRRGQNRFFAPRRRPRGGPHPCLGPLDRAAGLARALCVLRAFRRSLPHKWTPPLRWTDTSLRQPSLFSPILDDLDEEAALLLVH